LYNEFEQYKRLSQKEIYRLKTQQQDILEAISAAKSDLMSE
jgi:hypothetical protein